VGDLLRHQSGLADFDVNRYERRVLLNETTVVHDPIEDLMWVANYSAPPGCKTNDCTWLFPPGTPPHFSYSSTNYLLAGLILLRFAEPGHDTWQTFDAAAWSRALGLDISDRYLHTHFPSFGPLSTQGLSTVGSSLLYGRADIYHQDASIMGWCYGYVTASAMDVAQFYWDLLGPNASIVSPSSLRVMETWDVIDEGWGKNLKYGAGLELEFASHVPEFKSKTAHIGHAGTTYGFQSINGFFPSLNVSLSLTLNSDHTIQKRIVLCDVVEIIARHQWGKTVDMQCGEMV